MSNHSLFKYKKALRGYAEIFNNAKPKEKHQYIYPMRIAGISLKEAKEIGFKVHSWMWKKCLDRSRRKKGMICLI